MTEFTTKDRDIVNIETVYEGFYSVRKIFVQHARFEGGVTPVLNREMVLRRSAAGVLLFDPVLDKVVLIKQFRVGAMDDKTSPWLLEIVAGLIEDGEDKAELVMREAKEEANLAVSDLHEILTYYPSPGGSNEQLTVFIGRVDASEAGGVYGLEEEGEDIQVVVMDRLDAYRAITDGRLKNAASIIAMQWLQVNYPSLIDQWQ